jgi:hypothetical protein
VNYSDLKKHGTILLAVIALGVLVGWWTGGRGDSAFSSWRERPAAPDALQRPVSPAGPDEARNASFIALAERTTPASESRLAYYIEAWYSEEEQMIRGEEKIIWTHPGQKPVDALYFHLYPNAFASKKSTFIEESGGRLRGDRMKKNSFGHMQVLSAAFGGQDVTQRMQYVQPDDGNEHDKTVMRLALDEPVQPGQRVELTIAFQVKLPFVFARMGVADRFVMAGQWFPKIAVYEPAGTRGRKTEGWNVHQYHGNSEFYADFAAYRVRIHVPADYIVAATGEPAQTPVTRGSRKTYTFAADNVHDFAWAASPDFVYAEEPFSADGIPEVTIRLYLDPRHQHLQNRYFFAAKEALARYSSWYGTYPYSTLSIVVPPAGAGGAGGMEYPTLITAWAADRDNPGYELERVVVHEIGHQYWYGMVASNEFEEAWLDEGFTSYAEEKVMQEVYGVSPKLPLESSYVTSPAPLTRLSWEYRDHAHYAENVYTRGKLVLTDIERQIGSERMNEVLQAYFQRFRFQHPSTADFLHVLNDVTGQDWTPYFRQYVYGAQTPDYAVEQIRIKPLTQNGARVFENTVILRKTNAANEPVPLVVRFADGTEERKIWQGEKETAALQIVHTSPAVWAMVDPEYSVILENRHINNFLKAADDPDWNVRLSASFANLIHTITGFIAW